MRRSIIAGNWKMNMTPAQAKELVTAILSGAIPEEVDVVVCPPFVSLPLVAEMTKGTPIRVGAQNMHFEEKGAFTGEVSADMLTELGVQYVILGHSERRQYFAETDETVNKKVLAAFAHGLTPIVCVGESLAQREAGETLEVVEKQVRADLEGLAPDTAARAVIAYEPIWAIGTGRTATDDQAQEVIFAIRAVVRELFGGETAEAIRIQYGGSMNAKNVDGLMAKPDIDGGLIGGASLKAPDFLRIVNFGR